VYRENIQLVELIDPVVARRPPAGFWGIAVRPRAADLTMIHCVQLRRVFPIFFSATAVRFCGGRTQSGLPDERRLTCLAIAQQQTTAVTLLGSPTDRATEEEFS
jgi:hypothetical protein